jgi:hypothetical protein
MQARKLPLPESFRFVTSITWPPRPPTDPAALPSAPGNAGQPEPPHVALLLLEEGDAPVTVILADAALVESASLVAVTISVPAFEGAVYAPEELIEPRTAVQVTDLSGAVP